MKRRYLAVLGLLVIMAMVLSACGGGAPATEAPAAPAEPAATEAPAEAAAPAEEASQQPFVRDSQKIGRNDPCWCGSGKKFKQCHGKLS